MVEVKSSWLAETAQRRWEQLVAEDLKKRKTNQKKRAWPSNLNITQVKLIEEAKEKAELDSVIGAIEATFAPHIPPANDRGAIPFDAPLVVKEIKSEEKDLTYVPNYDVGEMFSHFIYEKIEKPSGYVLQPNERYAGLIEKPAGQADALWVEVPKKKVINIFTFKPVLKVTDLSSFTEYLLRQQADKAEFSRELVAIGPNIIESYQQFKLNVLKTISKDFIDIKKNKSNNEITKIELTNLCSFVEKYLKEEPLSDSKRHLIEILKNIRVELISHKSFFWDRIQKYVETPDTFIPPTPHTIPEIKEQLTRVRDHIRFRYAQFPEPLNINLYLSDVEAIIADLETLLRDLYYKYLHSPNLFRAKLWTVVHGNITGWKKGERNHGKNKERAANKTTEVDLMPDQPLKTTQADYLGAWDRQKGMIFKTQKREQINDNVKFDKETYLSASGENTGKGEQRTIVKDTELDGSKLNWMTQVVKMFLIYKDIGKILDKHFYTLPTKLLTLEEIEEWENRLAQNH